MEITMNEVNKIEQKFKKYITERYENHKHLGSFHFEYNHKKDEFLYEIFGVKVDLLENTNLVLEGLYEFFQEENENRNTELFLLIRELEKLNEVINHD